MKIITFAIPCYNSESYMHKCIESLLHGGEDVEIILINDGSKDKTPQICDSYKKMYPSIVKVIHQENGGHGEGINKGLKNATGLYYKVVDSDDWVDIEALKRILNIMRSLLDKKIDLFISNYVYEKVLENKKTSMDYKGILPENRIFKWEDIGKFPMSRYLLMHSVIYRTDVLRKSGIVLPKHTFYVDNIFVYEPLPYVETLYYINCDFYRYFIGREDQSVNEKVMISRVEQQLRVTNIMIKRYTYSELTIISKKLTAYMTNYLAMMIAISSVFLIKSKKKENEEKQKEIWLKLYEHDPKIYKIMRRKGVIWLTNFPTSIGKWLAIASYAVARKIYKFN